MAHLVKDLDFDLVLGVVVPPGDPHHIQVVGGGHVLQGLLLKVSLRLDARSSVVDSVVNTSCVPLLSGQRVPYDCKVAC